MSWRHVHFEDQPNSLQVSATHPLVHRESCIPKVRIDDRERGDRGLGDQLHVTNCLSVTAVGRRC
jgi:hypothetical protein